VIATGVQYSVRDFVNAAAAEIGIARRMARSGVEEKGYDAERATASSRSIRATFRPTEVETLLGDATKAREKLGWTPKITLRRTRRRNDARGPQGWPSATN
jgi:GDPmannose 4,6-dehydratase